MAEPLAPDPSRPARIKDVAALAGVSLKTVTNVVHERRYVKDETRARVKAAIDQLGYRPSLVGRQLQSGRSNNIALAVPRIDEPYLGALAHALIRAGKQHGYSVFIDETGGSDEQEQQAAAGYPGHSIDGVIFSPLALDPERMADMSRQTPMVLLGEHLSEGGADYVAIDNERSARDVVSHLYDQGRRRIAFIGGQPARPSSVGQLRLHGHRAELVERDLPARRDWLLQTERFSREAGAELAERLLPRIGEVDALVCASDLLAVGAIRRLGQHGVRVPDDVAVVGWDDIVDGQYLSPSLTTVSTDLKVLADQAITALVARIDGHREPARAYVVPHQLVVRESSVTTGAGR